MAETEPPGRLPLQHRVPIRAGLELLSQWSNLASALSGLLRGFFSQRVGRIFGRERLGIVGFELRSPSTYV